MEIFLPISFSVFFIGAIGIVVNKRNLLIILMSIELMLVGVNLNFIIFSVFLDDIMGQVFALYVLTVAAAESAIGLAILVSYFRVRGTIAVEHVRLMKG